jgi:hypothetical protein
MALLADALSETGAIELTRFVLNRDHPAVTV